MGRFQRQGLHAVSSAIRETVGLRPRLSYTPTVNNDMAESPDHPSRQLSVVSRAARLMRQPRVALMVLRMTSWVAVVSLAIKALPLPRAMQLLEPRSHSTLKCNPAKSEAIASLLDSVLATNFLFLTPTCWKRAPVLRRFLALEGIETRIVFGVRRAGDEQLSGHAWLEADGKPLHERTAPEYKVTFSFPC